MTKSKKTEVKSSPRRVNPKGTSQADVGRRKTLFFISVLVLVLLIIWGVIAAINLNSDAEDTASTPPETVEKVEVVTRSVTGKSVEEDRQDAVDALTELLKTADKSPDEEMIPSERLLALDKNDFSVVDKNLEGMIHYSADSNVDFKVSTYQSLITIAAVVKSSSPGGEIRPIADQYTNFTYADPEVGTVFVPLGIYVSDGAVFSFEMVYVDGEWKLAPYSLLKAVQLSATLQEQLAGAQQGQQQLP